MAVKVAIIYYSMTGSIQTMAERLQQTAEAAGAEVRLRPVAELVPAEIIEGNPPAKAQADHIADLPRATGDDVVWADVVLFGSPTRYGNVASQLKQFLDTLGPLWGQGLLADKVYAGFTASNTLHGGQESTLLALYNTIHHFGGFIVSPGYTDGSKFADGNPYGVSFVSGPSGDNPVDDVTLTALDHLATRTVDVAGRLQA